MSQQTWTPNPGVPGLADFWAIGFSHFFWGPPDFGGSGWRGDFFPISYIYREGVGGVVQ